MEFGKVIRAKREERNWTQEMLADKINVTSQAVSRWEKDISYPDLLTIVKLADLFRISTDELLGHTALSQTGADIVMKEKDTSNSMSQAQADAFFPEEESEPEMGEKESKLIILLDDAEFMRQIMKDIMTKNGHELLSCACGRELFELLEKTEPDLILLDIMLDGEDGLEILAELKKKRPKLRVLMLSALSTEYAVKTAKERGADGFIVKPFSVETLFSKISASL